MDRERWKKIDELFHSALRLPSGERNAFLSGACAGDSDLERHVQSLLLSNREPGFLDRPALEVAAEFLGRHQAAERSGGANQPGQIVGPYRLEELIGSGGMGEVWRAEQTEPIRRTVALKLIKSGMDTEAVVA